jgi:RND superfamily putative drug exporter
MVSDKHADATDSAVRRAAGGRRTLTAGTGPFGGLGRAVVRHPWLTILAWVVVAVAVIATSQGLPTTSNESSFLPKSYESIRAADLQDKAFPQDKHVTASAAIIVFSRADGGQLTAADSAKIASIASSLGGRHIHDIVGVTAGPASPNRLVQTALVAMPSNVVNGSSTAAGDAIKVLRADIKPLVAGTGLHQG